MLTSTLLAGLVSSLVAGLLLHPVLVESLARLRRRITWRRFRRVVWNTRVVQLVSELRPTLLIGLNDGIVPAAILARNLQLEPLLYCRVEHAATEEEEIRGLPSGNIADSRILVVDDQILTGSSMKAAYKALRALPGGENAIIKRLALFAYATPIARHELDYPPIAKTSGKKIKLEPWSLSVYHQSRGEPRSREVL